MTYGELETLVDDARTANDYEAIIDLMTMANVQIVYLCSKATPPTVTQPLRDLVQMNSDYNTLLQDIENAVTTQAVMDMFTPGNVLLSQYGQEVRSIQSIHVAIYTSLKDPDPNASATTATDSFITTINDLQNFETPDPCS